jgi:hypothetical protein
LGGETSTKANVFTANVDVHETPNRAIFFADAIFQAGKLLTE